MPAIYVDSLDDWHRVRSMLEPIYVTSGTHGRVLVPCANTVLVRTALVVGNRYNPNHVAPDKMSLLQTSIVDNGFCFPVVAIWDQELEAFVIIDGFHRRLISGEEWLDFDYIPVAVLSHDMTRRMLATKQFNSARGNHQVDLDADLIRALVEQGLTDEEVAEKLGMELDAVHRYKQVTGVAAIFAKTPYSAAWTIVETPDE